MKYISTENKFVHRCADNIVIRDVDGTNWNKIYFT